MAIEKITRQGGLRYRAVVRIHGQKKSRTFPRRIDAEVWERQSLLNRNDSPGETEAPSPALNFTVNEFREKYERDYCLHQQALSTRHLEAELFKNYVSETLGHIPIKKLKRSDVEDAFKSLREKQNLSGDRINRIRRVLHGMLNRAMEWGITKTNPVSGIRPYPSKQHLGDQDINYFSQKETSLLLDWLGENDAWLYPKVRLMLNTGLRVGEMVALRVGDLKSSGRGWCLTVSRSYCRYAKGVRSSTKGGHARLIPLGDGLGDYLFQSAQGRDLQAPLLFSDWAEYKGQTKFNKHFRRAMSAAKVRKIRVHDMRHTFAVHFLENGGHLYDLQKILGHRSSTLTERYSHFSRAMSERARGLVDHHAESKSKTPELTVVDGGLRSTMSHKCPTRSEMRDSSSLPASH